MDLSIVVPLLNEESNLKPLAGNLSKILQGIDYEVIFVDDGSTDNSLSVIKELQAKNSRVRGLSLSRNFGHQAAIQAGLSDAKGKAIVTLDADLQHPVELIPELIAAHKNGFEIVNTYRESVDGVSTFKNLSSKMFYWVMKYLGDITLQPGNADFRLLDRKVVDELVSLPEKDRFTRGLVSWLGFKSTQVPYHAAERIAGETKYTFWRMIKFALSGLTSFSSFPLRISMILGLFSLLFSFFLMGHTFWSHLAGETIQGWSSLFIAVAFFGGLQLFVMGILGEYIAKIFVEIKARPSFIIRERIEKTPDKKKSPRKKSPEQTFFNI